MTNVRRQRLADLPAVVPWENVLLAGLYFGIGGGINTARSHVAGLLALLFGLTGVVAGLVSWRMRPRQQVATWLWWGEAVTALVLITAGVLGLAGHHHATGIYDLCFGLATLPLLVLHRRSGLRKTFL